jgi:hypothetical protein
LRRKGRGQPLTRSGKEGSLCLVGGRDEVEEELEESRSLNVVGEGEGKEEGRHEVFSLPLLDGSLGRGKR